MRWQEQSNTRLNPANIQVEDIVFKVDCNCLPVDHAYALSRALVGILPWIDNEGLAGIHAIFGAASGNGWIRPDGTDDTLLQLPRRTKLTLRIPSGRVKDATMLVGSKLNIDGQDLAVGAYKRSYLAATPNLISRHAVQQVNEDEEKFADRIATEIESLGIEVKKLVSGQLRQIRTPEKSLSARSVMIADLNAEESINLQQFGVGSHRLLGCGIFIPSKI
ncbi:type I-MYXAN CRISPR-associated protein Cas6/Cmx6 [Pseudomonadota bacterium]